jgi:hypothetical protein
MLRLKPGVPGVPTMSPGQTLGATGGFTYPHGTLGTPGTLGTLIL